MSRARSALARDLRRHAQARAVAAFGRELRFTTAAALIDGLVAPPAAEAWLRARRPEPVCPECDGKGRAPRYPEQSSRYCPACDYDEAGAGEEA